MKNKPKRTPPKSELERAIDKLDGEKYIIIRTMVKSLLHDLESTKRENEYLKRMLEKQ